MPLRPMAAPTTATVLPRPVGLPLAVATLLALALTLALVVTVGPGGALAQGGEVTIETTTNGVDADAGPGPVLEPGQPVTWTWTVTATGATTLFDLVVNDTGGATPDCDVDGDGGPDGTAIHPGPLAPGQSYVCTATGTVPDASVGTVRTVGRVRAVDLAGTGEFSDDDPTNHTPLAPFVAAPGVTIRTLVNGHDAGTGTGPYVAEGSAVTWTYVVSNTGNVALSGIEVRDDAGLAVDCGDGSPVVAAPLAPGASITCTAGGTAANIGSGPQSRSAAVVAQALDPTSGAAMVQVRADDPASYVPVQLPGRLAFTGPADYLVPAGIAMLAFGGGLVAASRARRGRRPVTVPVRSDTERTG